MYGWCHGNELFFARRFASRVLRDQVYASLELIRGGHFPAAGAVEQDLAAQLKVSRTPLREALFQLCREGMLEDIGRGYRVRN